MHTDREWKADAIPLSVRVAAGTVALVALFALGLIQVGAWHAAGIAMAAVLALLPLLWLVRRTFAPLCRLTRAARAIAAGNYAIDLADATGGEVGALARALRTMQANVAERDALYRAVAATSGDGFWMTDMAGRILEVNDAYVRRSGYTREELTTMSVADLEARERPDEVRAHIENILQTGSDLFETEHRRKNGTSWPTEIRVGYSPVHGGRLFAFMRDITERKMAERSLRESRAALERAQAIAHIGSWTADIVRRTTTVSAEVMRIFRLSQATISWDEVAALVHPDDRSALRPTWKTALDGGRYDIEYRVVVAGRVKWLRVTGQVTYDAARRPLGAVGMMQDITAEREAELALLSYRSELERKVALRTADLNDANARIQLILDSSADGIFGIDGDGRFTFANPAACELLGYTPEQLIGRSAHGLIHHTRPDGAPCLPEDCRLVAALAYGRHYQCDSEVFWRADGRSFPVIYATRPILVDARVSGAVVNFFDITERKAAEMELGRTRGHLQAILDNMPAMIAYWDRDLRNIFVNRAYGDRLGIGPEQARGKHVREVVGEEIYRASLAHLDAVMAGRLQQFECNFSAVDGQTHALQMTFVPDFEQDTARGFFALAMDITGLKRAEKAAEAASRAKSEFLANMSHEIRTPLNAVLGLAQVGMRENYRRKARDRFQRIFDSGRHLLDIVNDILDFSKIEAGRLELAWARFDLGEVVDHAVDLVAAQAYAKGLDFQVDEAADLPPVWIGDPLRLTQILINLLSNAVKFTDAGRVVLSVWHGDGGLALRVADTGIGMSPEESGRLFKPFEQADGSITRRFGGTGLGLAISKRLIDLMDGSIDIQTRRGAGTAFEVWLPLAQESEAPAPAGGSVVLAGLAEAENAALTAALSARGIGVAAVAAEAAFDAAADLLVLDREAFDERATEALEAVRNANRKLAVACTPGSAPLSFPLNDTCQLVERPLRVRHLLDALARRAGAEAAICHAGPRLTGVRILAAEDNEVNRLVLAEILAQEGAQLTCAEDGVALLERLVADGASAYDVVVTDVQMPWMDGYEVAQHVHEQAPELPVIGLTAHALAEDRARCLAAGMLEHVTKPVEVNALVAAILRHVPRRESARPNAPADAAAMHVPPGGDMVNWDGLAARFKGNRAFIHKLAATALESNAARPAALREAAARGDFASLAGIAHGLKGMSGNLAAGKAYEAAMAVENAAREGRQEACALAVQLARIQEDLLAELAARVADEKERIS